MAKSNTKFSKGPGESSSGTTSILDLSDLEDDLFPDLDAPKNKNAIGSFVTGFKESFISNFSSTKIIRNFTENALPKGFSRLIGSYEELASDVSEIKRDIENTNASDLLYINQKIDRLLPNIKGRIPENLYNMLSGRVKDNVENYSYEVEQKNLAIRAKRDAANKAEVEKENFIKEALDHNTLVTKDIYNRSEQAESLREARRNISEGIRSRISDKRFDFLSKSMSLSVDSLTRLANYNEQVGHNLQKKSVEIQLRTYLETKEINRTIKESLKLHDEAYKALVRNTALPDHKKKYFDELSTIGSGTSKFTRSMGGRAAESLASHLFGYRGKLKGNLKKSIGSRLGEIVQAARMGDMAASMMDFKELWGNRYGIAGGAAGEWTANTLQERLMPFIGRQLRPELERFGDAYLGGAQHQTSFILDNIPGLLRKFVDSPHETGFVGGLRNQARDFLNPLLPVFSSRTKVDQGGFGNINEMAAFNEMTQRSIVDVIPGYLSRILHEIRVLRTGDETQDREVYDITSGKFSGFKVSSKSLMDRLITPGDVSMVSGSMASLLTAIDPDGKLSQKAQDALTTKLLRQSGLGKTFDPESFLTRQGLEGADQETYEEIRNYFRSEYAFSNQGKMLGTSENFKKRKLTSELFNELRSVISDPSEMIFKLIESGNTEMLRELDILYTRGGQDYLNYERIWDVMASDTSKRTEDTRSSVSMWGRYGRRDNERDELNSTIRSGKSKLNTLSRFGSKVTRRVGLGDLPTFNMEIPLDVYSKNRPSESLIKGEDLLAGTLVDAKTKKRIKTIKDITGPVLNAEGVTILTQLDFDMGLFEGERWGNYGTDDSTPSKNTSHNVSEYAPITPNSNLGGYGNQGTSFLEGFKNGTMDIYTSSNTNSPAVKASDLANGVLFDQRTGDPISSIHGITGPVVNSKGDVVITNLDIARGLYTQSGVKLEIKAPITKGINSSTLANMNKVPDHGDAPDLDSNDLDWYSLGNPEPVITSLKLKAGEYFSEDGKVITNVESINGPVYDRQGNQVVTEEDYNKGLINKRNRKKIAPGSRIINAGSGVMGFLDKFFKTDTTTLINEGIAKVVTAGIGLTARLLNKAGIPRDAYLPGNPEPILTVTRYRNNEYYNEHGDPIEGMINHKGPIYDLNGNLLLDNEQMQTLLNIDGTKHALAKNYGFVGSLFRLGRRHLKYWASDWLPKSLKISGRVWKGIIKRIPGIRGLADQGELARRRVMGDHSDIGAPNYDAYLPDRDKPVLYRKELAGQGYYDANGNRYENFNKVRGEIYDSKGNSVVTKEELTLLLNPDGTKHIIAKNNSMLGIAFRILGAPGRLVKRGFKALGKGIYGGLRGTIGRIPFFGKRFGKRKTSATIELNKASRNGVEVSTEANLLAGILDAVRDLKEEGPRVGSWQDKANKAKEAVKDKIKAKQEAAGLDSNTKGLFGLLKKGGGGLLGMLGLGKDKDDSSDDSSDDDDGYGVADALRDAALGDAVINNRRKGKKGFLRKLGKGRLGRLGKALGLGRVAALGAPLLAKGAALATGTISLVGSVLTAPVILGAAATAGVAYMGYKYYSNSKMINEHFRKLRTMQYGFSDRSDRMKILGLEDYLEKMVSRNGKSMHLKLGGDAINQTLKVFSINPNKESHKPKLSALVTFIEKRFKFVLVSWLQVLDEMGLKNIKINEIGDKLSLEQKAEFLDKLKTKMTEVDLTETLVNPFNIKKQLVVNDKAIEEHLAKMEAEFSKNIKLTKTGEGIPLSEIKPLAAGVTTVTSLTKSKVEMDSDTTKTPLNNSNVVKQNNVVGLMSTATMGITGEFLVKDNYRNIDGVTAIRLRAYGVETFNESTIYGLLGAEKYALQHLHHTKGRKLSNESYIKISKHAKWLIGSRAANDNLFYNWFNERFMPVVKTYYNALNSVGLNPFATSLIKDKSKAVIVGEQIFGSTDNHNNSVWEGESLHLDKLVKSDLKDLATIELETLRKAEDNIVSSDGVSANKQRSFLERGKEAIKSTLGFIGNIGEGIRSGLSSAVGTVKDTIRGIGSSIANVGRSVVGIFAGDPGVAPDMPSPEQLATVAFMEGNGGDWEKIPRPTTNKSAKAARPTLDAVEKMTGVPAFYLHVIASVESGFNWNATPRTSSAFGWFQFLNKTWDEMIRKYGKQFGLPADTRDRKLRRDPRINALMGAMFIKENYNSLKSHIKDREITVTDIYMAHFMGAGGARQILSLPWDTVAAQRFPKEARANRWVFYDKSGRALTVKRIYDDFTRKLASHAATFDGAGIETSVKDLEETKATIEDNSNVSEDTAVNSNETSDNVSLSQQAASGFADTGVPETGIAPSNVTTTATEIGETTKVAPQVNVSEPSKDIINSQNTIRAKEVKDNNKGMSELINIQQQQLMAVLDIRQSLMELVKAKVNTTNEASKVSTSQQDSKTNYRETIPYQGLMSLR